MVEQARARDALVADDRDLVRPQRIELAGQSVDCTQPGNDARGRRERADVAHAAVSWREVERGGVPAQDALDVGLPEAAQPHLQLLDRRVVEGRVRAVQHALGPDALDRLADLRVHRHARRLQVDVRAPAGDVDRRVDVDDVSVSHVTEDDLGLRKVRGDLLDRPRQREDRVAGVEEHGQAALAGQRHERVHRRVVRVVGVEQRVELDAAEARVLEEGARLVVGLGPVGVGPVERPDAGQLLGDLAHELVVGREQQRLVDPRLLHERGEAVPIERDVEQRELPDVHVRVEDHSVPPRALIASLLRC